MSFIELRSFDNYIEANIVLMRLQEEGINCHLKDEHIITIDPLLSPALGGMKLMVHEQQVKRAWELLEEGEKNYLKTIPCPVCKSHSLEAVFTPVKSKSIMASFAAMFLRGRQPEIKKTYTCRACGYDFNSLPSAPDK